MNIGRQGIGLVIGGFVLLIGIMLAVHLWQKSRSAASQGRVERSQAEAASNSAKDAIGTVDASRKRETASEQQSRDAEQSIRAAEGSNQTVTPAARDAGLAALCRRSTYANDPRCRRP